MGDLSRFLQRLKKGIVMVMESKMKEGLVIHHDEADGLSSAALTKTSAGTNRFRNTPNLPGQALP